MPHRLAHGVRLALLGATSVGCWWGIRALGDPRLHLGVFYALFAAAFAAYLLTLRLVQQWEHFAEPDAGVVWVLALIALVAVLGRLALLDTTPTLSDDIYRYRWDGRVQAAGLDPYVLAPNDPQLVPLRDPDFPCINFPHLRTIYPPMTELAFRVGVWLGPTLMAQKTVFIAAEFITCVSLLIVLAARGLSPLWVVAYAWHPLVILEIAGSGHNDALGIAGLWLGLAAWGARRWWPAAMAWSAAFLSKFSSLVLAPWWWCRRTARPALWGFLVMSGFPLALHPTAVSAIVDSLSAMTTRFESNASLYLGLTWLVGSAAIARVVSVGLLIIFLGWRAHREPDPVRYLGAVFAAALLLSPVVHPWYVVWLVPCFCFWRVPALVALTGTVVLAYLVWPGRLADGRWVLPLWAHILEYTPVLVLGLWELRRCAWRSSFLPATNPKRSVAS